MIIGNHLVSLIDNLFGISSEIMASVEIAQEPLEQVEIVKLVLKISVSLFSSFLLQ